ncbi:MAG: Crp/Fnr family transcriptional regulator [Deltaproteobacteria bacterium]|nr:Crp/Fnr family transcriptional regulator [Deltaproteobacteria bacterium]PWB67277.1 MAG: transcriptional regulator [Deltaproteobacteria bacterium]
MASILPEVLRNTPLFANLPPEDLRRVAEIALPRHYEKKDSIFREGERADGFYVVGVGRVKIFKLSENGKEQVLHLIGPGQSFAEATIFEGGTFPAHAEALEGCDVVFLPKRPFTDLLEKNPRIALRMMASLSRWLKRMTDLVESISLRDVEARLVRYLSDELAVGGTPIRDGAVLDLNVSKTVLASRLGTVPETFSRTLKKLQDEGKIRVKGKQIRIMKADSLFSILD